MDDNPFSQQGKSQDSSASRRRSTRIDFITTVLLSGKDSTGAPFREYTQTAIVNLHGCKVKTSYRILVGMLVNIECPKTGLACKGVCVRVWEAQPGIAGHEVAVQLIKPQNLWGVTNPPADWEVAAKNMVHGRVDHIERPPSPVAPRPSVATTQRMPIPGQVMASQPVPAAPTPRPAPLPAPAPLPTVDQRINELERRSTRLVESVLDILRGQAEEFTRNCLEEFRQQLDALIQDAEERLRDGLQRTSEESAQSLVGLRNDLMEQMASRSAQIIRSTEDSLRARLRTQLTEEGTGMVKPSEPVTKK